MPKFPETVNADKVITTFNKENRSIKGEKNRPSLHRSKLRLLRGSLPKSGPLDFATKNTFPLFFVGEEALVGIY